MKKQIEKDDCLLVISEEVVRQKGLLTGDEIISIQKKTQAYQETFETLDIAVEEVLTAEQILDCKNFFEEIFRIEESA